MHPWGRGYAKGQPDACSCRPRSPPLLRHSARARSVRGHAVVEALAPHVASAPGAFTQTGACRAFLAKPSSVWFPSCPGALPAAPPVTRHTSLWEHLRQVEQQWNTSTRSAGGCLSGMFMRMGRMCWWGVGGGGLRTEVGGRQNRSNDPGNNQHNPQYADYWAPLTRTRHIAPHPAQPQHTNYWAPRTRKRHQQEHRPQRPTERSAPTQHAKGRTGDCPGPRKEITTRRNVTRGGLSVTQRWILLVPLIAWHGGLHCVWWIRVGGWGVGSGLGVVLMCV